MFKPEIRKQIFALFFIPHLLNIKKIDNFGKLTPPFKQKSALDFLKNSNDYAFEFNNLVFEVINEKIYIEPFKQI